jgi:hypothetical protein
LLSPYFSYRLDQLFNVGLRVKLKTGAPNFPFPDVGERVGSSGRRRRLDPHFSRRVSGQSRQRAIGDARSFENCRGNVSARRGLIAPF